MVNIFIGGAWPYANGSLHVGHLSALLPGDVIASVNGEERGAITSNPYLSV